MGSLVFLILLPMLVVAVLTYVMAWLLAHVILHLAIWSWWCTRDRDVLFVYSDSPTWGAYVEDRILPRLGHRAVVLNWSQRRHWRRCSLARWAFAHFGGAREFNPLALVFRPFRRTRSYRFWQPFRDFKHGRPEALRRLEEEFFGSVGA